MMVLNEESVVFWFQGLKGHERIPFLRQLVNMCHPLELRFIALCVEDACRTDYLAFRTSEFQANSQNVLKSLTNPMDVEVRSKIIIYLCLLNSSNKLCSRILNQKMCDHDAVSQFCDDVLECMRGGDPPKIHELRTLEELRLLYTLAYLHPAYDFSERQHFRSICTRLHELARELTSIERKKEQRSAECSVPKPSCDGGSQCETATKTCSLCFSTSSSEHICKLRLLRRSQRPDADFENQVNVQWSTGKYSNLTIRDSQLRQLHTTLEGIISQPQLPAFPGETGQTHLNAYLQHLQGLSAFTWPRSQSVFDFFKQIASDQEQRGRPAGSPRPHSIYTPRGSSVSDTADSPNLTMTMQNGTVESGDDSSESSPPVLDDDAELKSYTIYNSSMDAATRAGSRSPLAASLRPPAAAVPVAVPTPRSPETSPWPPLPGLATSPVSAIASPPLANGHAPDPARPTEPRASPRESATLGRPQEASPRDPDTPGRSQEASPRELATPGRSQEASPRELATPGRSQEASPREPARSQDAERLSQMLVDLGLRKHAPALLPYSLAQLCAFSGERFSELGLTEGAVRRLRLALDSATSTAASTTQRRRTQPTASRSRPAAEPEPLVATVAPPAPQRSHAETADDDRPWPQHVKPMMASAPVRATSSPPTRFTSSPPSRVTASPRVSSASARGVPTTASGGTVGAPSDLTPTTATPESRPALHRQTVAGLPSAAVVMPAPLTVPPTVPTVLPGGQTQTVPTYSAVTARNDATVAPQYGDGGRVAMLENLVFTVHSSITPPPTTPLICSPYRPPFPPAPKSVTSSPSPPAVSPAPPPPPPPPVYLPRATFVATRPPPLPAHLGAFIYTHGGGAVSGFLPSPPFPAGTREISYLGPPFYAHAPYPTASPAPPPVARAPPPPPPRPPRFEVCYNCGNGGHMGRYCSADATAGDPSLNQNQFKLNFLSPTAADK